MAKSKSSLVFIRQRTLPTSPLESALGRVKPVLRDPTIERYFLDPIGFITDKLQWQPWQGTADEPGQVEILERYLAILQAYNDKRLWEAGVLAEDQLRFWRPGESIANRIRVEAGHSVGKTKLEAGILLHFFYCYTPSIIYTFAPTWMQIHDLLWKEVKVDHTAGGLPGKVYEECRLQMAVDWFATGKATNDARGQGSERVQGQHGKHLMFILDEAEGLADYVFSGVDAMASGGMSVVLMAANPRTRISKFFKLREHSDVTNFRISCLWHPNVTQGRDIIPGAVGRQYVTSMIEEHCTEVEAHAEEDYTFELPWVPGTIYRPDTEFLWRVLGIPPANVTDNTIIPAGLFEGAVKRKPEDVLGDTSRVRIGIDCARWGMDAGTVWSLFDGVLRRVGVFPQQETLEVVECIRKHLNGLKERYGDSLGSCHIRVDGGGGFGSGVIDMLWADAELRKAFPDYYVYEVTFNSNPYDSFAYADIVTEMYGNAAAILPTIRIANAPNTLETDLCGRRYKWVLNKERRSVKQLESKDIFRGRWGRSPDDGDGAVLAMAPDHVFGSGAFIR